MRILAKRVINVSAHHFQSARALLYLIRILRQSIMNRRQPVSVSTLSMLPNKNTGTLSCDALNYYALIDSSRCLCVDLSSITKLTALHLLNTRNRNLSGKAYILLKLL